MKLSSKLRRFTTKGGYVAAQLPTLLQLGWHWGVGMRQKSSERERMEDLTERAVLHAPLDADSRNYFRSVIAKRELTDWALPFSFFRLPDGLERKLFGALALERLHIARVDLVTHRLPPAERILDIGGAVDVLPQGALLGMGYPHRPKSITIVDLPDAEREFARSDVKLKDMTTADGTQISYVYTSMTELAPFPDNSFDMVWSGQSIEHVTEAEAEKVASEVLRVLRPGGYFCLDTPNRALTRLISEEYLHPEHRIEYLPDDLANKLEKAGFIVCEKLAVTPLPRSAALGRVSKLEILEEAKVSPDYNAGFSFYLKCQKPLHC